MGRISSIVITSLVGIVHRTLTVDEKCDFFCSFFLFVCRANSNREVLSSVIFKTVLRLCVGEGL